MNWCQTRRRASASTSSEPAMPRRRIGEREAELGVADDGERQEEQRGRPAPPRCRGRSRSRRAWRGRSRRARRSGRRGGRAPRRCAPRRGCASTSTRAAISGRPRARCSMSSGHAEGAVAGERPDDDVQHPVPDAVEARGGIGSRIKGSFPDGGRAAPCTAAARRRQPGAARHRERAFALEGAGGACQTRPTPAPGRPHDPRPLPARPPAPAAPHALDPRPRGRGAAGAGRPHLADLRARGARRRRAGGLAAGGRAAERRPRGAGGGGGGGARHPLRRALSLYRGRRQEPGGDRGLEPGEPGLPRHPGDQGGGAGGGGAARRGARSRTIPTATTGWCATG